MKSQLQAALDRLEGVKATGNGRYAARCPVPGHGKGKGDKGPSLSVYEENDKLLLYCHAGCLFRDIIHAMGLENIPPEDKQEVAHYDYLDADGKLSFQVVRYEPKDFRQRHWEDGKWVWNLSGVKRVLFNLSKVLEAKEKGTYVMFVEGEKDVMTLAAYDIIGTCIAGGANSNWKDIYTRALTGVKVAIIPDNDEPGRNFAQVVAASLYGWAEELKIIDLDVPSGGDTTTWFMGAGHDRLKLGNILNNAHKYKPPSEVTRAEFDALADAFRQHVKYHGGRRPRRDGI